MKIFCPFLRLAFTTSACHAVNATRGTEAASSIVKPWGLGARDVSLTATNSAKVPIRKSSTRA